MPRYYFHLVDGVDVILDPDGIELPPDALSDAALIHARDCMAGDIKTGRLDLGYRIDVHDASRQLVHSLAFSEALEIVGETRQATERFPAASGN